MKYLIVQNFGVGFITHEDKENFLITGFPGDIWVTDDSISATLWQERVGATVINKIEAQNRVNEACAHIIDLTTNENIIAPEVP
jgi:hypothetical protein